MEMLMIKPVSVLALSALELFWELEQMINKLSVQVLNAPLNFTLFLRIRRISKMSFNIML
jgi:hypothetical protein